MVDKKPLALSIVIPVYNEERYLKACLDSIAAQSQKPDEVIVVDNNSTDKTAKIASSYRFVKLLREPKQGVVYSRNRGFNAAKSHIIGRIDGDTVLPSSWVAKVKDFYQNPNHLLTGLTGDGRYLNVRLPRLATWLHHQLAQRVNRRLLGHYILWGSNSALPKALWQKAKAEVCERTDIHEDLDLSIHLHRLLVEIVHDPSLKVGVVMKRVRSRRRELLKNMLMWPATLKIHHLKTWVFGWLGAVLLWALSPIVILGEFMARLAGRSTLKD